MTGEEKRIYLRNLIALAKADEVVAIEESGFLGRISEWLEFDRSTVAELLAEANAPNAIDLSQIQRYSDRARCIEDMIELALIDGDVALNEKKILLVAAQRVGIDKETVGQLIVEARKRV